MVIIYCQNKKYGNNFLLDFFLYFSIKNMRHKIFKTFEIYLKFITSVIIKPHQLSLGNVNQCSEGIG